jgi:hypothetical protein
MIDPRTPVPVDRGQITDTTGKSSSERSNVAFSRFVAMAARDPALLGHMLTREQLGRKIQISEKDGRNVFHPI